MLGKTHQDQLPIVGSVIAGCQPAHQIGALQGCEGQQQNEFALALAGELEGDVIWTNFRICGAVDLLGHGPDVITVVERAHIGDVISQQALRLNRELPLRHPDVAQEFRGHGRQGRKQLGEGFTPGAQHRVFGITHIQPKPAVMGINHRLDRIAEIAQPLGVGVAIGIGAAAGEAIEEPVLMLFGPVARLGRQAGRHQVWLALEIQKWGQGLQPLFHLPAQQQQRIGLQGAGEQHPRLLQIEGGR